MILKESMLTICAIKLGPPLSKRIYSRIQAPVVALRTLILSLSTNEIVLSELFTRTLPDKDLSLLNLKEISLLHKKICTSHLVWSTSTEASKECLYYNLDS